MAQAAVQKALQGDDTYLRRLPPDLIRQAAGYLDSNTILTLCRVSDYFDATVCNNDTVWWQLIERDLTMDPDRLEVLREELAENKEDPKETYNILDDARSPRQFYTIFNDPNEPFIRKLMEASKRGFEVFINKNIRAKNDIDITFVAKINPYEPFDDDALGDEISNIIGDIERQVVPPAAEEGHIDILRIFVNKGYDLGHSLIDAVASNDLNVVDIVLEYKGDIGDDFGYYLQKSLGKAAGQGNQEMVDYFLAMEGVDINGPVDIGQTPLSSALEQGELYMARYLVSKGAVPKPWTIDRIIGSNSLEGLKFLVEELGIQIPIDAYSLTATRGHDDVLKYMLGRSPPANYDHIIRYLSKNGNASMIKYIFDWNLEADPQRALEIVMDPKSGVSIASVEDLFTYLVGKGATPDKLKPSETRRDLIHLLNRTPTQVSKEVPVTDGPRPGLCQAKTKQGAWCSRRVQPPEKFCWQHR